MLEKTFKLKQNGTDVKTEVFGGLTTFLSMAYILAINPIILSDAGMNSAAVFTATAISSAFATLLMAFYANYPIALASGMGLNAYFSYSVCIPMAQAGVDNPWQIALTAILVEGIIFILLTFCKFREALVNKIPENLKLGITAGIGLFIAFVGMKGAGFITADASTLVALGDMSTAPVILSIVGFFAILVLHHYDIRGAILWGILITWVLGMIAQVIGWYQVGEGAASLFPDFSNGIHISAPYFCEFNFGYMTGHFLEFAVIVFSFLFVDLFDTAGTLIGVAQKGNMLDENGDLPRAGRALLCDALGTIFGSAVGTSTVSSYVESSAGVASGARTGLASVVTGLLMIAALPLSPVFLAIPSFATAPALMFVGLLMASAIRNMDFEGDAAAAGAGFMALITMPLTYSIANGIMFGMITYTVVRICQGRAKDVHWVVYVSTALFMIRILQLIGVFG